jgi:tryptophan 2,3-dioxygenase
VTTGVPTRTGDPAVYGATDLDYNDYLKVPELLALQRPLSKPAHPDELLFIIIHQAFELWFKLTIQEVEAAIRALGQGRIEDAIHALKRAAAIQRLLTQQIHLLETMRPVDFLTFRDHLKPASGFQSLQFREIEFLAGLKDPAYLEFFQNRPAMVERLQRRMHETDLRTAYLDAVRVRGFAVPADPAADPGGVLQALARLYEAPEAAPDLYRLSETLLDLDEAFSLWRDHHVRVVERIIGFKRGTGGSSGAAYLRSTTGKRFFPFLWDVRTVLGEPR